MTGDGPFVFGYGSLASAAHGGRPTVIDGYRRVWGVAMDNSVDLPGYKYFADARTGERPNVMVAFLDLVEDEHASVDGVLLPVTDFTALDRRERNYHRREIQPGIHAYFGTPEARARFAKGPTVIASSYYEIVREPTNLPIRELRRIDLPEPAAGRVTQPGFRPHPG